MKLEEQRALFYQQNKIYESASLTFHGADGLDVYNSSVPFYLNGKHYIFCRVEKRQDWAKSWVYLFEETGKDEWTVVPNSIRYQLEDPFVARIHDQLVLGGTHVRKKEDKIDTYYGYFYKGTDLQDMTYFTTGPDRMKDIRLVELQDHRIGVFSRPRGLHIREKYGSDSIIGFAIINDLNELNEDVIQNAKKIDGLFEDGEWGGCNQCYLLDNGQLGIIGHKSYETVDDNGQKQLSYLNFSFVFDVEKHEVLDVKIIGTRDSYPAGPAKKPNLADCAFTAGITPRTDGKVDLYSGIGDTQVGRITIDNPFTDHGTIMYQSIFLP